MCIYIDLYTENYKMLMKDIKYLKIERDTVFMDWNTGLSLHIHRRLVPGLPFRYQNLRMFKSVIQNSTIFAYNLCRSSYIL